MFAISLRFLLWHFFITLPEAFWWRLENQIMLYWFTWKLRFLRSYKKMNRSFFMDCTNGNVEQSNFQNFWTPFSIRILRSIFSLWFPSQWSSLIWTIRLLNYYNLRILMQKYYDRVTNIHWKGRPILQYYNLDSMC